MIWWLGLAISLVPFTFGLVYLWRLMGDGEAVVKLPWGIEIEGTTGFAVFALGFVGAGGCLLQIAREPAPVPDLARVPAGKVGQIDGVVDTLVGPLSGEAGLKRVEKWLAQFEQARVRVQLDREQDLRRGDSLAVISDDAPAQLPRELADLDSDTTALLEVVGANGASVKATLDDGFAPSDRAGRLVYPLSAADAIREATPVRVQQRVVAIPRDEQADRNRVDGLIKDAEAAAGDERQRLFNEAIIEADRFQAVHARGFYAAEVLLGKGVAYHGIGELRRALATYELFLDLFELNPAVPGVHERIARIEREERNVATPVTDARADAGAPGAAGPTFAPAVFHGGAASSRPVAFATQAQPIVPVRAISVRASSTLAPQGRVDYRPANTLDGSSRTAWSEGARGRGVGSSITFRFDDPYAVTTMRLVNGNAKSGSHFTSNERLATVRITTDRASRIVRLRDTRSRQTVSVSGRATRSVRITIVSVYSAAFDNAMLSEVEFYTAA